MSALNKQKGGDHYKKLGQYQPWNVLKHWLTPEELRGFMKGTVIAYLARERDKGGMQDIEKSLHTLELFMELYDGEDAPNKAQDEPTQPESQFTDFDELCAQSTDVVNDVFARIKAQQHDRNETQAMPNKTPSVPNLAAKSSAPKQLDVSLYRVMLRPDDNQAGDRAGMVTAISSNGRVVAFTSWCNEDPAADYIDGCVYIYRKNGEGHWEQDVKLHNPNSEHMFGCSLDITSDGNTLIIGSQSKDGEGGSAYIYHHQENQWLLQAKLDPVLTGSKSDQDSLWYGYCVSISGNGKVAVIGTHGRDGFHGAFHVYEYSPKVGWVYRHKLFCEDRDAASRFSYSLSLSYLGTHLVVGAYGAYRFSGAAYVYTNVNGKWTEQIKLTSPIIGDEGERFGFSVAISEYAEVIVVGAYNARQGHGEAYVYTCEDGVWRYQTRLHNGSEGGWFGHSVSVSGQGNYIAVGAFKCPMIAKDGGAVYLFQRVSTESEDWVPHTRYTIEGMEEMDYLGYSVTMAADGGSVVMGAPGRYDASGCVYVSDVPRGSCSDPCVGFKKIFVS